MPESAWLCKNPSCGISFRWNAADKIARYTMVFSECLEFPEGEEVPMETRVDGVARPCCCPQCGSEKIESLGGSK